MRKQESWPGWKKWGKTISSAPSGMCKVQARRSATSTSPAGTTKARVPEYRQAGTKINKTQGEAEEEKETAPRLPGSLNTGKVTRERREGRKGSESAPRTRDSGEGIHRVRKDVPEGTRDREPDRHTHSESSESYQLEDGPRGCCQPARWRLTRDRRRALPLITTP